MALRLLSTAGDSEQVSLLRDRVNELLAPFAWESKLTAKGESLLRWAAEEGEADL